MLSTRKSRFRKIKLWEEQGNDEAAQNLIRFIAQETDEMLKAEAVKALGGIRSMEIFPPLTDALRDPSAEVRSAAAHALGETRKPQAVDPLLQALRDPSEQVRARAAESLGKCEDPRAVEPLVAALKDKDWEAGNQAATSLARLGDGRVIIPLLGWMERVFTSMSKKLTASEKLGIAREAATLLIGRLDEPQLQAMASNMMLQVNVKSWEVVNPESFEYGWVTTACKNPIWKPVQDEIERRRQADLESIEGAETQRLASEAMAAAEQNGSARTEEITEGAPGETSAPELVVDPSTQEYGAPLGEMPRPVGVVADFLAFLKEKELEAIVLIGGAVRDAALGRMPRNLDVTVQLAFPGGLLPDHDEPVEWNMQFAEHVTDPLVRLAETLQIDVSDLIAGKAIFSANGVSLPIQYVGPYLMEEVQTKRNGMKVEQRLHRTVSRLAIVANLSSDRAVGLVAEPSINRMWIDSDGRWHGDSQRALFHLNQKRLRVDPRGARPGPIELFRLLAAKHALGFTLAEETIDMVEAAARRINQNLPVAVEEFSRESFDRAMAAAELEDLVHQFEILDLVSFLMDVLEPAGLLRINDILSRRETERTKALQEYERNLSVARQDAESRKSNFESRRLQFREHFERMDQSKSTRNELEARLRRDIDRLREADEAARAAALRLNEATKSFRAIAAGEAVDPASIREHREALADKKIKDEKVEALTAEVETLRTSVRMKQQLMQELQDQMERLGQEIESAAEANQQAEDRVREAENALERVRAEVRLSPERKRDVLRGGPAPAEMIEQSA